MKQIGLIVIGIVALVIVGAVVFIKTLPQAKLTIRTIGPTGEFRVGTNVLGRKMRWPIWRFAITNQGRAEAVCGLSLHEERTTSLSGGTPFLDDNEKAEPLKPKEGRIVTTAVPPYTNSIWLMYVQFRSVPSPAEEKISPLISRIPSLSRLLPKHGWRERDDGWHRTTNAAPSALSFQNGTNL